LVVLVCIAIPIQQQWNRQMIVNYFKMRLYLQSTFCSRNCYLLKVNIPLLEWAEKPYQDKDPDGSAVGSLDPDLIEIKADPMTDTPFFPQVK
jgi:hypothetical protein